MRRSGAEDGREDDITALFESSSELADPFACFSGVPMARAASPPRTPPRSNATTHYDDVPIAAVLPQSPLMPRHGMYGVLHSPQPVHGSPYGMSDFESSDAGHSYRSQLGAQSAYGTSELDISGPGHSYHSQLSTQSDLLNEMFRLNLSPGSPASSFGVGLTPPQSPVYGGASAQQREESVKSSPPYSPQSAAGTGSPKQQHSLYKTELCRSWEESGSCRYGSKCQFAHGRDELRPVLRHPKYKTEVCRTFSSSWKPPHPSIGLQNIFPARKLSVRRAMPLYPLSRSGGRGRVDNGRDANDSPHRSLRTDLWKVSERESTGLERRISRHAGAARSAASSPRGGPIRGRILSRLGHSSRRRGRLIRRRTRRRFAPITRIRLHRRLARSRHIRSRRLPVAAASARLARALVPRARATTVASLAFDTPFNSFTSPPRRSDAQNVATASRDAARASRRVAVRPREAPGTFFGRSRHRTLRRSPARSLAPPVRMSARVDDVNVPRTPERASRARADDAAPRARIVDKMRGHRVGDAFATVGVDALRVERVEALDVDWGSSESEVTAGGAVTARELAEMESFLETLDGLPTDVELGDGDVGFLEGCLGSLSGGDGSGREESACGDARVGTAASDDGASSSRVKASSQTNSGESEEERRLRLSRNRESAQNSRARKKEYVSDLEKRARALEQQNSELQAMVINLTHENHALRLSLQSTGFAVPSMMMPCVYPVTPKLPLPPIDAQEGEPLVQSSPSQLEVKKPAAKRRRQTAVASATALVLGAMSVVGLVTPGSQSTANRNPTQSTGRRLLAIEGPPVEDQLVRVGINITSLREEIAKNDDERSFSLPDRFTSDGIALWGDTTSDGRTVNLRKPTDANDPWFSAFNAAGMHSHVNLLSRVACKELFKFKRPTESSVVARTAESEVWEEDRERVERRRNSGAIPMPPSAKENVTSVAHETGDENSIVSVLLPPPIEGVMQQLSKLFVVTFNKRTADYTTHSCLMPQPMTSVHRHV